jgi:hypothetical protein
MPALVTLRERPIAFEEGKSPHPRRLADVYGSLEAALSEYPSALKRT